MGHPIPRASPVIRPSRGPGPSPAPMYSTLASALSTTAKTIAPSRTGIDSQCGSSQSPVSTEMPTSTTLLTVPTPGHWRSGIQASRTTAPVSTVTVPKLIGSCRVTPWWKTSHGSKPTAARIITAIEKPYSQSPANRAVRRPVTGRASPDLAPWYRATYAQLDTRLASGAAGGHLFLGEIRRGRLARRIFDPVAEDHRRICLPANWSRTAARGCAAEVYGSGSRVVGASTGKTPEPVAQRADVCIDCPSHDLIAVCS